MLELIVRNVYLSFVIHCKLSVFYNVQTIYYVHKLIIKITKKNQTRNV